MFHNHLAVDAALSLFEFGSPAFVRLRETIWLAGFAEAAAENRSFIFTFAPEASVQPDFIGKARDIVESAGGRVLFVALTCDDEGLQGRITASSRKAFGKLTSVEEYRALRDAGAFFFPSVPEPALSLNTEVLSPDESARRIENLIEQAAT